MERLKFKTTIKCSGCIATVTPVLNKAVGEHKWEVDIKDPDKVLTVDAEESVDAAGVVKALEGVGYKAERI
jgi:copper chaperone CopZ